MLCKQLSGNGQSSADNYMVKQGGKQSCYSLDMTLKESKGCINQVGDLCPIVIHLYLYLYLYLYESIK